LENITRKAHVRLSYLEQQINADCVSDESNEKAVATSFKEHVVTIAPIPFFEPFRDAGVNMVLPIITFGQPTQLQFPKSCFLSPANPDVSLSVAAVHHFL